MANLRPRVQELVDDLLDEMSRTLPPVDFHALVSLPLPVLVICELLGVPYADRDDFRRWSDDAADMRDGTRSRAGLGRLQAYMAELLERKRSTPAEDVLSDLLAAQTYCIGAPLARIELQAVFSTLFRRFPMLRLAVPVDALRTRSHLLTGGLSELPLAW